MENERFDRALLGLLTRWQVSPGRYVVKAPATASKPLRKVLGPAHAVYFTKAGVATDHQWFVSALEYPRLAFGRVGRVLE